MPAIAERKPKRAVLSPMSFRPSCADDLIGQAHAVAKAHLAKARRLRMERGGSCKWDWIEWRGRKRDDSVFVGARGPSYITTVTRRAESFGESLQPRG